MSHDVTWCHMMSHAANDSRSNLGTRQAVSYELTDASVCSGIHVPQGDWNYCSERRVCPASELHHWWAVLLMRCTTTCNEGRDYCYGNVNQLGINVCMLCVYGFVNSRLICFCFWFVGAQFVILAPSSVITYTASLSCSFLCEKGTTLWRGMDQLRSC